MFLEHNQPTTNVIVGSTLGLNEGWVSAFWKEDNIEGAEYKDLNLERWEMRACQPFPQASVGWEETQVYINKFPHTVCQTLFASFSWVKRNSTFTET